MRLQLKYLVCKRSSSHSRENQEKTCWGWHPLPSLGHWRAKVILKQFIAKVVSGKLFQNSSIYCFQFFQRFTDSFTNITTISLFSVDNFFIFLKGLCFHCNQKLCKPYGASISKSIYGPHSTVQPFKLQDFAYKYLGHVHTMLDLFL